jgi:hypothetical protein
VTKPELLAITPRWGRALVIFLAIFLTAFALDRYLSGLEGHKFLVRFIAPAFADEQLDVLATYPLSEALHRLGGALLLTAGLAQFSTDLRRRRPKLHRWSGYLYVVLAISAGCSGAYMGVRSPFGGVAEAIPSVVFGALLVVFTLVALAHARKHRFEVHREWMVRSYALVLGPMAIRAIYVVVWFASGIDEHQVIGFSFWAGWLSCWGAAEWWIAQRKRRLQARRSPEP